MTVLYYVVLVLHITACLFLIGVVLLQQGKGQDLASAFGGGGTQTAFGPRGSANVLSRATTILAGVFMLTSLTLTVLKPGSSSVLDRIKSPAASQSPAPGASPTGDAAQAPAAGTPETTTPATAAPAPTATPTP
jgi:preprotein translocase subunit SecG